MVSFAYAGSSMTRIPSGQPDSPVTYTFSQDDPGENESYPEQPNNGTYVHWDSDKNSTSDEWTWEHQNWLFGPSPEFKIFHENGSEVAKDSYAEIGEVLTFQATIPKNIFTEGQNLSEVRINGWYMTPDWNFSADFGMSFRAEGWGDTWSAYSSQYNQSEEEGGMLPSFIDLVVDDCSNHSDASAYYVNFAVKFTVDAPLGLYELHMDVMDTDYNNIGSYGYASGYEFHGIAVGMPPSEAWSWSKGGSYTLEKVDLEGDSLYSVSRQKDFIMRFNITGDTPSYVQLGFKMPSGIDTWVNATGWHQEVITEYGGWTYDEALGTYVWNDSLEVTYIDDVYGEYKKRKWVEFGTHDHVNVTWLNETWHEDTQTWTQEVVNESRWVERQLFFVYNETNGGTWESYYGYSYWGYPYDHYVEGEYNREITVHEPMPEDLPILYELNTSLCTTRQTDTALSVDFVGHFTEKMPKTDQYSGFRFKDMVMGPEGNRYWADTHGETARQTWQEYQMAKEITIESPVTLAKVLTADGRSPGDYMFAVEKGQDFMVKGRLQGGGSIADDIDGAQFSLEAGDGYWTENESRWSRLIYTIDYDVNGTPTFTAFNFTEKQNYTYGTYEDYVKVNVTGWHYVYNSTTDTWDWVYGNYTEWQWKEVAGWHWAWWYYNQKTGQWQEEYINHRSSATKVNSNFCTTSNFTKWTDGGDLYVSWLVNMSEIVPETNYWWNFAFMNDTWYEDYSSDYGQHKVKSWDREWVYSFDHQGERVYMDKPQPQLAFKNDTLCNQTGDEFLMGRSSPYIMVDGQKLPIEVHETYDSWSGDTYENILMYDHYDPENNRDVYTYELVNGTMVYVTYDETIHIYNVTLGTGESFLTAMQYHHGWDYGGDYYYSWIDIDGVLHQGTSWEDYADYSGNVQIEYYDKVEFDRDSRGWIVRYGAGNVLELAEDWRWDSRTSSYFMTDIDGNLYNLQYNNSDGYYYTTIDGQWHRVSWPKRYFETEYEGSTAILLTWDTHRFWFTEIGGVKYEMPYPGANADYHYQLNEKVGSGGMVPTTKSVLVDDTWYPVYNVSYDYFVDIGSDTYELIRYDPMHTTANGTHIWNPTTAGWSAPMGTYNGSMRFEQTGLVNYTTESGDYWPSIYSDSQGDYEYITLTNGTTWILNWTTILQIYEYDYYGDVFYSLNEWPVWYEHENETYHYYEALNGSQIVLDGYEELPVLDTHLVMVYYNETTATDNYDFLGETYLFEWEGYWKDVYYVHNATYSSDLYVEICSAHSMYNFSYDGSNVTAYATKENIYRMRERWGFDLVYGPQPIESAVYKNIYDIVIGTPEWGMWGVQKWTTNPENGAVDLDGNLDTSDDQYYVREEYCSTDSWTHEYEKMWVGVDWEPNATQYGDEMHLQSWMGLDTFTWSYEWNQTFYWYDADTMELVNQTEWDNINSTLRTDEGEPKPGYWDIAWMAKNVTWADIVAEAEEKGYDWIDSNEQTWTWLSFGVGQDYGVSTVEDDVEHYLNIGMHYEYSGLLIWEDANNNSEMDVDLTNAGSGELSHYLMPKSVANVSFVKPGERFGNFNDSGDMRVNLTDEVTWGVTFEDINGTVYPYTMEGYWGWYSDVQQGSDYRTFDERPTKVTVEELSFLVHFQGHVNETAGATNNWADLKVDNTVGDWSVDMIGGRDNLENKSLGLNYFAEVSMTDFAFKANGTLSDNEQTVSSETFEFETSGARFAEMIMGGVTYDWSKNTTAPYEVVSHTTPLGTFRSAFESSSGRSATAWTFSSNMYYVTIGFPEWEGYSVYQDPVFVSYVSNSGTSAQPGGVQFGSLTVSPDVPQPNESVRVGVDIYSEEQIDNVQIQFGTSGDDLTGTSGMWEESTNHYVGDIPGHPEGTQIFFQVVVYTSSGEARSSVISYIVGEGLVTTTTTTRPTGPGGGLEPDVLVLIAGGALALVVIIVLVKRRKN
jgi:hypothetical protein